MVEVMGLRSREEPTKDRGRSIISFGLIFSPIIALVTVAEWSKAVDLSSLNFTSLLRETVHEFEPHP